MDATSAETLVTEITDFLVLRPTLEEIIALKVSEELDKYLHALLNKNSNEGLSVEEQAEMEKIILIEHLMTMLKANARLKLMEEE